jgi:hypothetical protein
MSARAAMKRATFHSPREGEGRPTQRREGGRRGEILFQQLTVRWLGFSPDPGALRAVGADKNTNDNPSCRM